MSPCQPIYSYLLTERYLHTAEEDMSEQCYQYLTWQTVYAPRCNGQGGTMILGVILRVFTFSWVCCDCLRQELTRQKSQKVLTATLLFPSLHIHQVNVCNICSRRPAVLPTLILCLVTYSRYEVRRANHQRSDDPKPPSTGMALLGE